MSFIDLMANTVWSESDIVTRTEEIVHGQFSVADEAILNRKTTSAMLGQYTLTADEQADIARYAQVCEAARQAGVDARADMALLNQVFPLEAAQRRLTQYRLADGKPAESTGVQQVDENGVPVVDADGNPVMVMTDPIPPLEADDPLVAQDDAERAGAQAVVDAATPEAMALATQRAA